MQLRLRHALSSLAVAVLGFGATAQAAPVVAVGSTYDFTIVGSASGTSNATLTFDGLPETFFRTTSDGSTATVIATESEQDLGGGMYRLLFNLTSTGDLYPVFNENALIAIGALGDPIDLLQNVRLDVGYVRYYGSTGAEQGSAEFILPQGNQAWNGAFYDNFLAAGAGDFGGRDTRGLQVELRVSAIPEPQSAALAGIALLGLYAAGRRRAR